MKVTVKWIANASVRGVAYRPGQRSVLDEGTARVYAALRQCEILEPAESAAPESKRRKTVRRGKSAETAAKTDGEQR